MTYRWIIQDETGASLANVTLTPDEAAEHADRMDRTAHYTRDLLIQSAHLAWSRTFPDGGLIIAALYRS